MRLAMAPDDERFVRALVRAVPALVPIWQEHLADNLGEPIPHVFMGDVTRWVLSQSKSRSEEAKAAVRNILKILDEALTAEAPSVGELIGVSFAENLPIDSAEIRDILPYFGPALASEYKRYVDFATGAMWFSKSEP